MTHTRSFVIRNELLLKNDVEKTVLRFLGHHRKHIKQRTERKSRIFVSFFLRVKIKKKKNKQNYIKTGRIRFSIVQRISQSSYKPIS